MATVCSIATGNFLTAGTWGLVDATSFAAGENAAHVLTTAYSGARSAPFTPGAITIDAIAVKLNVRTGTTGTISVNLEKDSDDSQVAGTEVTINCADLPAAVAANFDGGWVVFKLAAPVLLITATAYQVAAKTSSGTQVSLWRHDATVANICRFLRTTTTQAPTTGDDFIVAGEYTGAGTGNSFTVTMNETAATDYGSTPTAANSLLTGCSVNPRSTLQYGVTAATNYVLRISNALLVYLGGTFNMGTTGSPMPRDSTAVLEFDGAADGDYGLLIRGGTCAMQGLSRTSGKNVWNTLLNTDEAVNSTSLGIAHDTGWLDNDIIAVASTTRTVSQCEAGQLNGNANAADITVDTFAGAGGGLAFAHSGTSPTQAEVILLTRNVKVRSTSSTIMAYFVVGTQGIADIDWTEFRYLGENVTNKRGVEVATVTGSFNMQFSSIYDSEDMGFFITGATANNIVFSNNAMWNIATITGPGASVGSATTGTNITIDGNILIRTSNSGGWSVADSTITFTNNIVVGASGSGITFSESALLGTVSGNVAHSGGAAGFTISGLVTGTMTNSVSWRNTGVGYTVTGQADFIVDGLILFGNTTTNLDISGSPRMFLKNAVLNGDTTFATNNGLLSSSINARRALIFVDDCDFSTASGIKVAHSSGDIGSNSLAVGWEVYCRNTKLGATAEITGQTAMTDWGIMASNKHDQVAGAFRAWLRGGNLQNDTTIYNIGTPSLRMTPNSASVKLISAIPLRGMQIPVANGQALTVSVFAYKSVVGDGAVYNGAQPRLWVRANPAVGIASDTLLATGVAANGLWEQLSGVTAAATDDGVLEFFVDCDGTTGWVNIDDWAVVNSGLQGRQNYFLNGLPYVGLTTPGPSAGLLGHPGMAGGLWA